MNEMDAMAQLAEANPVREGDLMALDIPGRFAHHRPNRRLSRAVAVVALAGAAWLLGSGLNSLTSAMGTYRVHVGGAPRLQGPTGANGAQGPTGPTGPTGTAGPTGSTAPTGSRSPAPPQDPTTAFYANGPTGAAGPTRTNSGTGMAGPIALADARDALGAALVLPDVPPVDPSGVTKVVKDCGETTRSTACDIGIGFLAQRVWIYYQPADQWGLSDPLAAYKKWLKNDSQARIVYLSGTPAYINQEVQFLIDGVHIRLWSVGPVPPDAPTLQAIAQSIVDRSK